MGNAQKKIHRSIQWQDWVAQMYPEKFSTDGESKNLCRTVTFQVTDDCNLACFTAGTKILMDDFSYKNIEDIKIGDTVLGFSETTEKNKQLHLQPVKVTHTFIRHAKIRKLTTSDGGEIITTDEHPFLDGRRNWKRAECLTKKHKVQKFYGVLDAKVSDIMDNDYMIGYIISSFLGDGSLNWFKHGELREEKSHHQDRLAVKDTEIIDRICSYLDMLKINYKLVPYKVSEKYNISENALYIKREGQQDWLKNLILENLNKNNSYNYNCGFLAGIIDTEGSVNSDGCIRIFNSNSNILKQCESALTSLGYSYTYDKDRESKNCVIKVLRIVNNRNSLTALKLIKEIQNAVTRKGVNEFNNLSLFKRVQVESNIPLDYYETVYNFETESHTYIANDFAVHNCTYCYQINKGKRSLSFENAKLFIDKLLSGEDGFHDYVNPEISPGIIIEFIGGEPFLEIELIDKITDYFRTRCVELNHPWAELYCISICSNGTLYFDERVQNYLKKNANHMSFSVTIDGNKELHDSCRVYRGTTRGSYDDAVAAANDWISKGHDMGSKITIAPGNLIYMGDAIKHMYELGYDEINANCVYEKGWTLEHAQLFYKELKKIADFWNDNDLVETHYLSLFEEDFFKPKDEKDNDNWCGGVGSYMLSIDPDGDLYPCIRYMESSLGDKNKPLKIGNVKTGIAQTKEEQDIKKCLDCITRRGQSTDECFYCPIGEGCSWCSAYNYQEFGTVNKRATYICDMHKARSLANAYFWNTYYKKHNIDKCFKVYCPPEWAIPIVGEEEYNYLLEMCGGNKDDN